MRVESSRELAKRERELTRVCREFHVQTSRARPNETKLSPSFMKNLSRFTFFECQ